MLKCLTLVHPKQPTNNFSLMNFVSKCLILILMVFGALQSKAQTKFNPDSKWSLSLSIGPQISDWSWQSESGSSLRNSFFTEQNMFSADLLVGYQVKKSSFELGLGNSFHRFKSDIFVFSQSNDPAIDFDSSFTVETDVYINIPIIYKYHFYSTQRLNLYAGLGLANKFRLLDIHKFYVFKEGEKNLKSTSNTLNERVDYLLAAAINIGIDVAVSESFNLGFSPSFEQSLFNYREAGSLTIKYHQINFNLNVTYRL